MHTFTAGYRFSEDGFHCMHIDRLSTTHNFQDDKQAAVLAEKSVKTKQRNEANKKLEANFVCQYDDDDDDDDDLMPAGWRQGASI